MDPMAIVSGFSGKASSRPSSLMIKGTAGTATPKMRHKQVSNNGKKQKEPVKVPSPLLASVALLESTAKDRNRSRSAPPGDETASSSEHNGRIGGKVFYFEFCFFNQFCLRHSFSFFQRLLFLSFSS